MAAVMKLRAFGREVGTRGKPVHRDRQDQQDDERRVPVAVEDERQDNEDADAPPRMRIGNAVDDEGGREEDQQKRIVVEQHRPVVSNFWRATARAAEVFRKRAPSSEAMPVPVRC